MATEKAKFIELRDSKKEIQKISEAAQIVLKEENNIYISKAEAIPTIVAEWFKQLGVYVANNTTNDEELLINFAELFTFGITTRESEDGEKEANRVPVLVPGQALKTIIKSDETTEDEE